jgi:hypothetical protein
MDLEVLSERDCTVPPPDGQHLRKRFQAAGGFHLPHRHAILDAASPLKIRTFAGFQQEWPLFGGAVREGVLTTWT